MIDLIPEQKDICKKGGTMRLGAYPCRIDRNSVTHRFYQEDNIVERHRHRWEVNPEYIGLLEKNGMKFSGKYPERNLMEILEL